MAPASPISLILSRAFSSVTMFLQRSLLADSSVMVVSASLASWLAPSMVFLISLCLETWPSTVWIMSSSLVASSSFKVAYSPTDSLRPSLRSWNAFSRSV